MGRFGAVLVSLFQLVILALNPAPVTVRPSMKIDTHCHFIPSWYKDIIDTRNISNSTSGNIPEWDAATHLEVNAMFGITTSVVSASLPCAELSGDNLVEEGRALSRRLNDYGYNLTVQYPKRFLLFATLPLPDLEGALIEAVYALDTLQSAGIFLPAISAGELLGAPRYAPLYQLLNERRAVVFVHPSRSTCSDSEPAAGPAGVPSFVLDFLLDTSKAAVNLVYRNVTRDYPNITFILAHAGGFLSFAASRAGSSLAVLSGDLSNEPAFYTELSQFNVDVALSTGVSSLASSTAFFNKSCMTFGSDYPYIPLPVLQENIDALQNYVGLHAATKHLINHRNAFDLFERFLV